jgi:hypothetical protein
MKFPSRRAIRSMGAIALLASTASLGGELPLAKQGLFLARAMAYDGNLKARAGGTIDIGILAKKGDVESERAATAVLTAFRPLEAATILGLAVKVSLLSYAGRDALDRTVRDGGIDALYVCNGLDGALADVRLVARARKVLTLAGNEAFLKKGLSLGVFVVDEKNTILVNLESSREEGVAFGPELLRLATVVR